MNLRKNVKFRKSFKKDMKKLSVKKHEVFLNVIKLFLKNPIDKKLRRHKLKGRHKGLESIDVTPDSRALFIELKDKYVFYHLKNHNQLYG